MILVSHAERPRRRKSSNVFNDPCVADERCVGRKVATPTEATARWCFERTRRDATRRGARDDASVSALMFLRMMGNQERRRKEHTSGQLRSHSHVAGERRTEGTLLTARAVERGATCDERIERHRRAAEVRPSIRGKRRASAPLLVRRVVRRTAGRAVESASQPRWHTSHWQLVSSPRTVCASGFFCRSAVGKNSKRLLLVCTVFDTIQY